MKYLSLVVLLFTFKCLNAQPLHYIDSIRAFRENYISTHGVIREKDRIGLQFFPVDTAYCKAVRVERIYEAPWFAMPTSGKISKTFRVYAQLHFSINGVPEKLSVYQSQQLIQSDAYKNYLFIPFTDLTNGEQTYDNGRYIDLTTDDLEEAVCYIDFNKAYNPYCAYVSNVYNCPIPPVENHLGISIKAGEKKFNLSH